MIKKIVAFSAIFISAMALLAVPAFAENTSMTNHGAVSSTTSAATVACVAAAVNTREQALDSGFNTYTQSTNSAYSARASALQAAYALTTGNGAIRTAVRAAWSAFSASMKSARGTWQKTRNADWTTFRASVKTCKAPSSITDAGGASLEASGQ
jgi:hypothetical protein